MFWQNIFKVVCCRIVVWGKGLMYPFTYLMSLNLLHILILLTFPTRNSKICRWRGVRNHYVLAYRHIRNILWHCGARPLKSLDGKGRNKYIMCQYFVCYPFLNFNAGCFRYNKSEAAGIEIKTEANSLTHYLIWQFCSRRLWTYFVKK